MSQRKIIHLDLDAFFASVEQRDQPSLRGKPVIVGGSPKSRGVVCAASYEARRFGVRSAMSCAEAFRRCPSGIFVAPRFSAYREASDQMMEILQTVTPLIEPLSLDEAYLDVTENLWNEPSATRIATELKKRIRERIQLTASAGVSYNKFLAKIASDLKKPDGLVVIRPQDVESILPDLPVERLWGVGKKTAERLAAISVKKVADLRNIDRLKLIDAVGPSAAGDLILLAHGQDDRPVISEWDPKSCGTEQTFAEDILAVPRLLEVIGSLSGDLGEQLQERHWYALTLTLKVKYHDFLQVTRSRTLTVPTQRSSTIETVIRDLLIEKTEAGRKPIRLLGVAASGLIRETDPLQLVFEFMEQDE